MQARLDPSSSDVGPKYVKHLVSANKVLDDSTLPEATRQLVNIRASQINGCSGCLDMHTKDAAHAGETSVRLNLVAAWREAAVFRLVAIQRFDIQHTQRMCDIVRCHSRALAVAHEFQRFLQDLRDAVFDVSGQVLGNFVVDIVFHLKRQDI